MRIVDSILWKLPERLQTTCALTGGFLVHMTLGSMSGTIGNIIPYVVSYLKGEAPGEIDYALMAWLPCFLDFGNVLTSALGGILEKKIGARLATLLGATILTIGVTCGYITVQKSFWLWILSYAFVGGMGMGICYNAVLTFAMHRLPRNRGVASGIIMVGFALGSAVFRAIETAFVNPENFAPDASGFFPQRLLLDRVPSMFVLLGVTYFVMNLFGCILLIDYKTTDDKEAQGEDDAVPLTTTPLLPRKSPPVQETASPRQAIGSWTFWCLWISYLFINQPIKLIANYSKAYGQTFISDDFALSALGAVAVVFAGIGKIVFGFLGDRLSFRTAMIIASTLMTVLMGTLCATRFIGNIGFYIWVVGIYFALAAPFALYPMGVAAAFGQMNAGVNFGVFYTSTAAAGTLSALTVVLLLNRIGFCGLFDIATGFSFITLLILLIIHRTKYGQQLANRQDSSMIRTGS